MTVHNSVKALELPTDQLKRLLREYAAQKGSRHTPSVTTVKIVLVALSIRQRKRSHLGYDVEVVNESVPQIMAYFDLKKSTVDDALAFLTWSGLIRTIKKGGGRGKNPTIRHVDVDGFVSGKSQNCAGENDSQVGELLIRDGDQSKLDGESPDTPLVQPFSRPSHKQVCVPSASSFNSQSAYDVDELIAAYQFEIDSSSNLENDFENLPEYFSDEFFDLEPHASHHFREDLLSHERRIGDLVRILSNKMSNDCLGSRGEIASERVDWSL